MLGFSNAQSVLSVTSTVCLRESAKPLALSGATFTARNHTSGPERRSPGRERNYYGCVRTRENHAKTLRISA